MKSRTKAIRYQPTARRSSISPFQRNRILAVTLESGSTWQGSWQRRITEVSLPKGVQIHREQSSSSRWIHTSALGWSRPRRGFHRAQEKQAAFSRILLISSLGSGGTEAPPRASSSPPPARIVEGAESRRPIMQLLDLLGRRWALRILWELRSGPRGFRAAASKNIQHSARRNCNAAQPALAHTPHWTPRFRAIRASRAPALPTARCTRPRMATTR